MRQPEPQGQATSFMGWFMTPTYLPSAGLRVRVVEGRAGKFDLMARLLAILLAVAVITASVVGCATQNPRPLPKPAHWYGTKIYVPVGYAQGVAAAVCYNGELQGWWAAVPFAGGELLECSQMAEPYE